MASTNIVLENPKKVVSLKALGKLAQYECTVCQVNWQQERGPTQCPQCGHLYVRWLNYIG